MKAAGIITLSTPELFGFCGNNLTEVSEIVKGQIMLSVKMRAPGICQDL